MVLCSEINSEIDDKDLILWIQKKDSYKKIPHICSAYNIPCLNLNELAQQEGWTF